MRRAPLPGIVVRLIFPIVGMLSLLSAQPGFTVHQIQESERPFRLPFLEPPGPDSWLFTQSYGNTVFAYRNRASVYGAGQGLHFGIDFAAGCGTPVVAIGDGEVFGADVTYHGAGPHNLIINHPNGYASLYGHLLERSPLDAGQRVTRGQFVGLTGDPDLSCSSRPHLHLEIRDSETRRTAYNPALLIDVDWDRLALSGSQPLRFQQDLLDPNHWQSLQDQPEVQFGGSLVNEFEAPWPYDW